MKIERIRLKNFKTFQDVTLENIPAFCVVIGANGTGKSTLFDVFGFLKDCLTYNVTTALQTQGGFNEVISREAEERTILIELTLRTPIAGEERLVIYHVEIVLEGSKVVVAQEGLYYRSTASQRAVRVPLLEFKRGNGYAMSYGADSWDTIRESQKLDKADILALKGLGQFQRFEAANKLRQLIENWHISDLNIQAALGSKGMPGYADHLSVTGDNLPLVAHRLYTEHPDIFQKIVAQMQRRVPGIGQIEPEQTIDGRLLLKFKEGAFKDPFLDRFISDGTLKMFAYLTLLYDPEPHPLLCVEEPENQLYPKLLWELAEEFRAYAWRGGQVFVSTHSPEFLNAVQVDEVFWLKKRQGYTEVCRASDDSQVVAYMKDGDQMGYLWEHGFFKEVDP